MSDITFDLLLQSEVEDAWKLEHEAFPADEADTLETFWFRYNEAGALFMGAFVVPPETRKRKLIGFICSTLSANHVYTRESMFRHTPDASSVCIHSVVVDNKYRGREIGLRMSKEYVLRIFNARREQAESYERILLITHGELRGFYEKVGFECTGKSDVVHGSKPWYEMKISLVHTGGDLLESNGEPAV